MKFSGCAWHKDRFQRSAPFGWLLWLCLSPLGLINSPNGFSWYLIFADGNNNSDSVLEIRWLSDAELWSNSMVNRTADPSPWRHHPRIQNNAKSHLGSSVGIGWACFVTTMMAKPYRAWKGLLGYVCGDCYLTTNFWWWKYYSFWQFSVHSEIWISSIWHFRYSARFSIVVHMRIIECIHKAVYLLI